VLLALALRQLISPRFAAHMGWDSTSTTTSTVSSPATSTVSSPTTLSGRFSSPERIVPAPVQLRSPSVEDFHPPRQPGKQPQHSSLRAAPATPSRTMPIQSPSLTSQSLSPPKPLPSNWTRSETQSEPDDELIACMQLLAEDSDTPVLVHDSVTGMAERGPENALPLVLAEIMPEESSLSHYGTCASLYPPI